MIRDILEVLGSCCSSALMRKPALKGIVHPKIKILSSFTHPQVVTNLYECVCSVEHKGRYSEDCGKQSSFGAPLTSIVIFFLLWKSMVPQNSLITNFLKIYSFVFSRTKTFKQVLNYLRVSKWWQNFYFWVNYPFKPRPERLLSWQWLSLSLSIPSGCVALLLHSTSLMQPVWNLAALIYQTKSWYF